MAQPFENISITLEDGAVNDRIILSGEITLNSGAVNNAPVAGSLIINGGTNEVTGRVTGSVAMSSGLNKAAIDGNLSMQGGTNASTAIVNGNATISSGTNNAYVSGNAIVSGGTNAGYVAGSAVVSGSAVQSGNVDGSVRLEGGSLADGVTVNGSLTITANLPGGALPLGNNTTVKGNIVLGAAINSSIVLEKLPVYTGTILTTTTVDNVEKLLETYYLEGSNEGGGYVTGVYYNLDNDSKAYDYTATGKEPITGPYFNLTGDGKAYNWTGGVKQGFFTGYINSVYYSDGVVSTAPAAYAEFTVTNGPVGGKLYTATGGSVIAGPVYTDTALTAQYTGVFTYSGTTYYSESGTPNTYRAYTVTGDPNYTTLYTQPVFDAAPGEFIYTDTGLSSKYSGYYKYENTYYSADDGTVTPFDGAGTASGKYYNIVAGSMNIASVNYATDINVLFEDGKIYEFDGDGGGVFYTGQIKLADDLFYDVATGILGAPSNSVFVFVGDQKWYSAVDGLGALLNGAYFHEASGTYMPVINGELTSYYWAAGVLQLVSDGKYYTFLGGGVIGPSFNGAVVINELYYSVVDGVRGGLFNGAAYVTNIPRPVNNGALDTGSLAAGLRQLASDGKYYTFPGDGNAEVPFNGAVVINGLYYSVVDGVRGGYFSGAIYQPASSLYVTISSGGYSDIVADGILQLAGDGKYYTFPGNGNAGVPFNGAIYLADYLGGVHLAITAGVLDRGMYNGSYLYADGVQVRANDGLIVDISLGYNAVAFTGLYYTDTETRLVSSGVLNYDFTGACIDIDNNYRHVVDGLVDTSAYASGIHELFNDGRLFSFSGYSGLSAGTLFNGAYFTGTVYRPINEGELRTDMYADSVRMLVSDLKYYYFPGDGTKGEAFDGAYFAGGTNYLLVLNGERQSGVSATAQGNLMLVDDHKYYYFNNYGQRSELPLSGVASRLFDGRYYIMSEGAKGAPFNGAYLDGSIWRPVVDGVPSTTTYASGVLLSADNLAYYTFTNAGASFSLFNGAYADGISSLYRNVYLGVVDFNSVASGVLQLANDSKVYTFTGSAGLYNLTPYDGLLDVGGSVTRLVIAGDISYSFNGAYLDNGGNYRVVTNGAVNTVSVAQGAYLLHNNNTYTDIGPSGITLFSGAAKIGSTYFMVSGGQITQTLAEGVHVLANDQRAFTFSAGGTVATLYTGILQQDATIGGGPYTGYLDGVLHIVGGAYIGSSNYCDSAYPQVGVLIESTVSYNVGDKVLYIGKKDTEHATYTVTPGGQGQFISGTDRIYFDAGLIAIITPCSNYGAPD